jgi:translation elongation factor EF-1beta
MADTVELKKHINYIENRLKNSITVILSELKLPIDFNLNSIDINLLVGQEFGRTEKPCGLEDIRLNVNWEPHRCQLL